jgi:hypothetical protein
MSSSSSSSLPMDVCAIGCLAINSPFLLLLLLLLLLCSVVHL